MFCFTTFSSRGATMQTEVSYITFTFRSPRKTVLSRDRKNALSCFFEKISGSAAVAKNKA